MSAAAAAAKAEEEFVAVQPSGAALAAMSTSKYAPSATTAMLAATQPLSRGPGGLQAACTSCRVRRANDAGCAAQQTTFVALAPPPAAAALLQAKRSATMTVVEASLVMSQTQDAVSDVFCTATHKHEAEASGQQDGARVAHAMPDHLGPNSKKEES